MDKKAKNILFNTYWKNGCWIDYNHRQTSSEDFEYAKSKGLMFDPLSISHDQLIEEIIELSSTISKDKVAAAFLSSLSSRRLDWRSSLASYFFAKQFVPHKHKAILYGNGCSRCAICEDLAIANRIVISEFYKDEDLNVLNFEKIKWGGVRIGDFIYTLFDLQQIQIAEIPEPSAEDIDIFKNILSIIYNSQPNDYARELEKNLAPAFKSNKDERGILISILGAVQILKPKSCNRPYKESDNWDFLGYWRGEDKYDEEALNHYFGKYI